MVAHKLTGQALPMLAMAALLWVGGSQSAHAGVSIAGLEPQLQDIVLAYLRLDDEACDAPDWRVRRLFIESETEIREALEVVGYYSVAIDKKLRQEEACWQADYTIKAGPPVILRDITIVIDTGSTTDETLQAALQSCQFNSGQVLRHAAYDACRRAITRAAERRGYFSAEFVERRIDVYPDQYAADINLQMVTGPRYVFGQPTVDQEVLDQDLIERFVDIVPGEFYDAERVRRLQRDLVSSTYFDQVIFTPAPRGAPHFDVPVHVELTPGKQYQFTAGVGFATDVGPKLRGGVLNRRVNEAGHQAEAEVNLSRVISNIDLTYRIPLDKPRDWITFDTGYKIEDNDSFESRLFTAGAQRIQRRKDNWVRTLFLELRLEDFEAGAFQDSDSELLTPGIGYAYVEEDYPPRPLSGHRSRVQLRGAVNGLISDTSFLQLYGNTKWVFGLWPGARLLTRAEAGFTAIDRFPDLPASVRFFAGGDTSIRGYGYNTLGPTDPLGAVIGGSNLLVGSVEVDQQIAGDWAVAAFIDSGNAYDEVGDFNPATGVGAGIRWFSPLGPIRIDVAVPLESNAPDDYRFHITLGPDL